MANKCSTNADSTRINSTYNPGMINEGITAILLSIGRRNEERKLTTSGAFMYGCTHIYSCTQRVKGVPVRVDGRSRESPEKKENWAVDFGTFFQPRLGNSWRTHNPQRLHMVSRVNVNNRILLENWKSLLLLSMNQQKTCTRYPTTSRTRNITRYTITGHTAGMNQVYHMKTSYLKESTR